MSYAMSEAEERTGLPPADDNAPKPSGDDVLREYLRENYADLVAKADELTRAVERADTAEKKITLVKLIRSFAAKAGDKEAFHQKPYSDAMAIIGGFFSALIDPLDLVEAKLLTEIEAHLKTLPKGQELRDEYGHLAFWQKAGPEIIVENKALLKPEFLQPDMKRIKAAVEAGLKVPGVTSTPQKRMIVK